MALSETLTETSICNMALGKLGATRINDVETDTSLQAILCRLHYEQTRNSLLRSHWWRFATERVDLVDSGTTPDFEWDYEFDLPTDFLRMKSVYEDRFSNENLRSYAPEGSVLLTNEDEISIRYIKKVTDVTAFDPLFIEVLVLQLALKMIGPLAGGDANLQEVLQKELSVVMRQVKTLDAQETNTEGEYSLETWNDARYA
jgi:hypothetical protein